MESISKKELYEWCRIPLDQLTGHPNLKVPLKICRDSEEMGALMARELVDEIQIHNQRGEKTHAILPCGPTCWYQPFTDMVNQKHVSLKNLVVFHMDECLDWQGRPLPRNHPLCFQGYMEDHFYKPVLPELRTPEENRNWTYVNNISEIAEKIANTVIDITYGGWGQDGHLAYNQTRRHPFSYISLDDLRNSTVRVQENNIDTITALATRFFGSAYQFVPPMSVTLGMKELLKAKKVRIFSDKEAWTQTALRVALFGPVTTEYPMTLLQEHPDALITATLATAAHTISEHPEWDLDF